MQEGKLDDLISSLPFEVQKRVVSLLPLKEAVRTSTLSTFWRSLWFPIQLSLDFDPNPLTNEGSGQEIEQVMGMFLRSYACPEKLELNLKVLGHINKELVVKATKGVEQELHVEFFETQNVAAKTCLSLHSNPAQKSSFFGVKLLHLRSVTHLSKPLVSMLLSNCNVLESLRLVKCRELESLEVETESLQSLVVEDCSDISAIVVSAPNLISFEYHGALAQIEIKNTVSLVNVVLDLRDGPGSNEFDCEDVLPILASLKDVEVLTVSGWLLEWLCSAGVIFGRLEFQFNKLKELSCIDSVISKDKRDSLACFLNSCPSLMKLSVEIESKLNFIPSPCFHQYWHEPHLWMDFKTVKTNTSNLEQLKSVDLVGFVGKEDELLLMDLLLEKAINLNSLTLV
ncbi:putative F-box domain, leucine-rich repeat domain, L domain-containing protein [Rosa chinensis]|uniref:Putative F-box domain, leucine-rich repeat domain, L domain-containing protein n=1 Tax=Rosa chinensis TaxID=74649 RepID=A0A2P6RA95_ROSCH|nr:F-box protein At2g39490 isoform X1 [Rosa chinensis]PRQ43353.1 putative F-box domain, leucine-rich repeat domain, L domain-containing protein [Rosa chinensis]